MTLRTIAQHLLTESSGDLAQAKSRAETAVSDPELRAQFDAFVRAALLEELSAVYLAQRSAYRARVTAKGQTTTSKVMDWATSDVRWLDWPMSDGRVLGDFNKAELDELIAVKAKRLATEQLDLAFYRAVSGALKTARSTVKGHLKEADLRQMRKAVERQSAAA